MRRLRFFFFSILLWIVIPLLKLLAIPLVGNARYPFMATLAVIVLIGLFWTWAGMALVVKRLHDLDRSGWHYVWMFLVPGLAFGGWSLRVNGSDVIGAGSLGLQSIFGLVSFVALLYLLLARGSDGPNRFGYPP